MDNGPEAIHTRGPIMYTSRQDPQQLLVLQQAAGYLNISVDELLQLQRAAPHSDQALSLGASGSRPNYARNESFGDDRQVSSFFVHENGGMLLQSGHTGNVTSQQQDVNQLAMAELSSFTTRQPIFDENPSSPGGSRGFGAAPQEEVILLNPEIENAWYACNMDYQMIDFGEISGSDPISSSGTDSFVHIAVPVHDSDAESESTARDGDVDMSSEDDAGEAPSLLLPADRRSTSSLASRQYRLIAPRPGPAQSVSGSSGPTVTSHRVRKKRAPYSAAQRIDTSLTRSVNACVRCRIQRNRVRTGFSTCPPLATVLLTHHHSVSLTRIIPEAHARHVKPRRRDSADFHVCDTSSQIAPCSGPGSTICRSISRIP